MAYPSIGKDVRVFLKQISKEKLSAIYLIVGEEEALLQNAVQSIKARFQSQGESADLSMSMENFDAAVHTASQALEACLTVSFFGGEKLVVVERAENWKGEDADNLLGYAQKPENTTHLVLVFHCKPDVRFLSSELAQAANVQGAVVKCWKPFENERPAWLKEQAQKLGLQLADDAAEFLAQEGGESLSELQGELEKTALYLQGKTQVSLADVQKTLSFERGQTIWEFVNQLESGKIKRAGQTLLQGLEAGEEPIAILALIARSLRQLETPAINKFWSKAPSAPKKTLPQKTYALLMNDLRQADLALKTGQGTTAAHIEKILVRWGRALKAN